ncbi:MAG: cobalt ECF transporter T component CbiQ [Romboutsia sp.]
MILIDKYAYTNKLRHVNPIIKTIIGTLFLCLSMLFNQRLVLIGIILLMSILVVCIAKIDLKNYLRLLKIPMIFLIIGIGLNLINIGFSSEDMIYSFKVSKMYIGTSVESIKTSVYLLFRSISCLTCVYFIVLTTPFNDLLFLLQKICISDTVIELSMLIYRFIFIFLEEIYDIKKSQELRFGYSNVKNSYRSVGILGSMLFKRMMRRYEDMSISLDVKLYDGKFHIVGDKNV